MKKNRWNRLGDLCAASGSDLRRLSIRKSVRFRLDSDDLRGFVTKITTRVPPGTPIQAVMEPTGMALVPTRPVAQRRRRRGHPRQGTAREGVA